MAGKPGADVCTDDGRKSRPNEDLLPLPGPRGRGAVRLADHRLLLIDSGIPDDRTVSDAAGGREAEQCPVAQGRDQFRRMITDVAEEEHVRLIRHCAEERQDVQKLSSAHRHQHEVELLARGNLADCGHPLDGFCCALGVRQNEAMRAQVGQPTTAGKHDHLMPGPQQLTCVDAADDACSENKDSHQRTSFLPTGDSDARHHSLDPRRLLAGAAAVAMTWSRRGRRHDQLRSHQSRAPRQHSVPTRAGPGGVSRLSLWRTDLDCDLSSQISRCTKLGRVP